MRILHIAAANMFTGGGERHVADLLDWQIKQGHICALVAPQGGDLGAHAQQLGAHSYPAEIASGFSVHAFNAVSHAIALFKPDIVHVHGHRAALFGRLADPEAKKRLIYTLHGIHIDLGIMAPFKRLIEGLLKSKVARFIVTAEGDLHKAELLGIAKREQISLVYNGISLLAESEINKKRGAFRSEALGGLDADTVLILHVGRLNPQKDHPTLIAALALIDAQTDWHIAMVCPGDDSLREELQKLISNNNLDTRVSLKGAQNDLSAAYVDADIFTLSSLTEGTPYSLIEAMQAETAIVATGVGGIPEAVQNERSGLIVRTRDPSGLAQALTRVIDNKEERLLFAKEARDVALTRYTLEAMAQNTFGVYELILKN